MERTNLITKAIATFVLVLTITTLVTLDEDSIALIAILSGIAGSAATFLFSPKSGKE